MRAPRVHSDAELSGHRAGRRSHGPQAGVMAVDNHIGWEPAASTDHRTTIPAACTWLFVRTRRSMWTFSSTPRFRTTIIRVEPYKREPALDPAFVAWCASGVTVVVIPPGASA